MRRALPFFACLCFMALVSSSARASFDAAGQPSLGKTDPAPANKPVARNPYAQMFFVNNAFVLRADTVVWINGNPVKFVIAGAPPPPAKKPVRPRPLTK
jgi:hypothetical protein